VSRSAWDAIEPGRRLVHAGGVLFPVPYLAGWLSWRATGLVLALGVGVVAVLEYLRLGRGLDHAVYDRLTRPYEADGVAGYALYMASMTAVALAAPPATAIPGMLMLAIADPISGVLSTVAAVRAGGSDGDGDGNPDGGADDAPAVGGIRKRPAVAAATFLVCLGLAAPFAVGRAGPVAGAAAAAAGAAGATLADAATPVVRGYVVDDNLTIPVAAAVGIEAALLVAG